MTKEEIKKIENKPEKVETSKSESQEKVSSSVETPKQEKQKSVRVKKEEITVRSFGLHASKKHCMYISNFIKGKSIDKAIEELQQVLTFRRAIPFKGEVPHRKGNIMSGRYPINATKYFISILKNLRGAAILHSMDLNKTRIASASSNWGSRPARRGGIRAKRTNVILTAKNLITKEKN